MNKTLALIGLAAALILVPVAANSQERLRDGLLGAGAGALVGGPAGAVAGGAIGYTAGPRISRGGYRGRRYGRRAYRDDRRYARRGYNGYNRY